MKKYLIILPAIALSVANLSAGDGSKKKSPETIFAKADANSDGKVTLEEITEATKEKADKKTKSN